MVNKRLKFSIVAYFQDWNPKKALDCDIVWAQPYA